MKVFWCSFPPRHLLFIFLLCCFNGWNFLIFRNYCITALKEIFLHLRSTWNRIFFSFHLFFQAFSNHQLFQDFSLFIKKKKIQESFQSFFSMSWMLYWRQILVQQDISLYKELNSTCNLSTLFAVYVHCLCLHKLKYDG